MPKGALVAAPWLPKVAAEQAVQLVVDPQAPLESTAFRKVWAAQDALGSSATPRGFRRRRKDRDNVSKKVTRDKARDLLEAPDAAAAAAHHAGHAAAAHGL